MRPTIAILSLALASPLTANADENKSNSPASTKSVPVADPIKSKKEQPPRGSGIRATVQTVDAERNVLSVGWNEDGRKANVDLKLAKDVAISLADQQSKTPRPGKLADLAPGTNVLLDLSPDRKTVTRIEAHGSSLSGAIKAVDQERHSLTVERKDKNGPGEQTLAVGENTKVTFAGGKTKKDVQEGRLADLTPGTPVTLQLSVDRKIITAIAIQGLTVHGSLKQVDNAKRSITVTTKGENGPTDRTFMVAEDAAVTNGSDKSAQPAKLSDLTAGISVVVQTSSRDPKTVTAIRASKPTEFKKKDD